MENNTCQITLRLIDNRMIVGTISSERKELHSDSLVLFTPNIPSAYFFPWLVNFTKTIYDLPLSTNITITLSGDNSVWDPARSQIQSVIEIIQNTRKTILKYSQLSSKTQNFKSHLFLNLGEVPFLYRLYKKACEKYPEEAYYSPCQFLNGLEEDRNLALLENSEFGEGLIQTIVTKKIRYIYTHNISYLSFFLEVHKVDLPVLFEHIGVELIIVDFDIYSEREGEYFLKKMTQNSHFRRFSIFPNIDAYWDHKLNIKTHYFGIPYDIKKEAPIKEIQDYKLLITSWSRTDKIIHFLKPILLFLSYVDAEHPFFDFQFLFHTLSYILKYKLDLPLTHKMRYFTLLSEIYFHTNSLLKFELLHTLQTKRIIHLYGDQAWKEFFPQYYQGETNQNDLKSLLTKQPYLLILMNANYSYFENNPMFIRALNSNNPYLGFSSVLRTPELDGLSHVEFSNIQELNSKIECVNQLTGHPEFQSSRSLLSDTYNECNEDFYLHVFNPINRNEENLYEQTCAGYKKLFEEKLEHYFGKNRDRIQECLSRIIREDFLNLKPQDSILMNRSYFRRIVEMHAQQNSPS